MRKKWILIGLAAVLLMALVGGGAVMAWGGKGQGWSWGRGGGEHREAVASKVADILGTDADETADAIDQAQREVREEAANAALEDLAGRVAAILGTDASDTATAIKSVSQDLFSQALEERLQSAIDDGRITEEQAQEYRDKADSYGGWHGLGYGRGKKGGSIDGLAEGVAEELDVESDDVKDAIEQALSDIRRDGVEAKLQQAIDSGKITEDEAEEIRSKIESGDWRGFGKGEKGHHRGKERRGRERDHHGSGDGDSGGDGDSDTDGHTDGDST